jgi:hypothetical protein
MIDPKPLDPKAVDTLAGELLQIIHAHYIRRPRDRQTVFEVLNALASVSAFVIGGCAPSIHTVRTWFSQAMAQELAALKPGEPPPGQRH